MYGSISIAQCSAGPDNFAIAAADTESHQRAAPVEIETNPIPPCCFWIEVVRRPFAIEPRRSRNGFVVSVSRNCAGHREIWDAVIITGVAGPRTFAAVAIVALQQNRL